MILFIKQNMYQIFAINFRADDDRIILEKTNDDECKLSVKNTKIKDIGEWQFDIQTIQGQNKTLKKYTHHISIKSNGKSIH